MLKIIHCKGNGQGSCKRCEDKGIWNRHWTCFLYKIEGQEGCYCEKCIIEVIGNIFDNPELLQEEHK